MWLRPSIPIAWRITVGLLLASIIPLTVVTYWGSKRGTETLRDMSYKNLRLVAKMTAARLDQFVGDSRMILAGLSRAPVVVEYCRGFDADSRDVENLFAVMTDNDPGILAVYVTDLNGHIRASSDIDAPGMDVSFREYWKRARAGELYVSTILIGKRTGKAGMYFAAPVPEEDGFPLGVVFVKFDANIVRNLVADVAIGAEGRAVLIDDDSIILAGGRDEAQLYSSTQPISVERLAEIDPQRRWGRATIPLAPMGNTTLVAQEGEEANYRAVLAGREYVAGSAPLGEMPWTILAYEPVDDFEQPLRTLLYQQGVTILLVMLFAALFAFTHSRSIVRPVHELSEAAARIAAGHLDTRVHAQSRDEIGKLADAFNAMIPKLESGLAMRQSLQLAREVQSNLLPDGPPEFEGLDCGGVSYSAEETGGDYFDFIDLRGWGEERLLIAVGDVVGHGVAAALLMATARANLRSRARPPGELDALFNDVNRLLAEDVRSGQFMSLLLMALDPAGGQVTWVNAGHHPPLHFHAASGTVDKLQTGNPPLGVLSEWTFQASPHVPIESGDVFLLGTDGIWEAQNTAGEQYGHDRLQQVLCDLHERPAEAIVRSIRGELERFMVGTRQADDITIVVAKVL